mmetsp:Transcript_10762/g.31857  ORF Transcript_10762/g.31857 Transcript_10762/m.31857 type:complete len:277 (-) Transcript_10762:259-1089(-)
MRVRNSCSLFGVLANMCTFIGVPVDEAKHQGSCPRLARLFSAFAMLVDLVDLILDVIFIAELFREEHSGWGAVMACASILAHGLDWLYEPIVKTSLDQNGMGMTFAYYFGTSELIIFLVEDTATIFLFSRVAGAYDAGSVSDALNLLSTLVSAVVVSAFVSVGGLMLVLRGRSAFWIPNLWITKIAGRLARLMNVHLSRMMSVLILLKCAFVAALIGFYTYVTVTVVLEGNLVDGGLSVTSTTMFILSVILALMLSLRSPVKIKEADSDRPVDEED